MLFAPVSYSLQAALKALSHCSHVDSEISSAAPRSNVCKAKKVERLWWFPTRSLRFLHRLLSKLNEPGLLGMQGEPVFGESLSQHFQYSLRVLLVLKAQDEIIGEPHFVRLASQPGFDLLFKPFVKHVVQVNI